MPCRQVLPPTPAIHDGVVLSAGKVQHVDTCARRVREEARCVGARGNYRKQHSSASWKQLGKRRLLVGPKSRLELARRAALTCDLEQAVHVGEHDTAVAPARD